MTLGKKGGTLNLIARVVVDSAMQQPEWDSMDIGGTDADVTETVFWMLRLWVQLLTQNGKQSEH